MQALNAQLYTACLASDLQTARWALAQGANVNAVFHGGDTALYAAAKSGSLPLLRAVTAPKHGANPNSVSDIGMSPMHAAIDAAQRNSTVSSAFAAAAVDLLLTRGADQTLENAVGDTALGLAAEYKLLDVVDAFLDHPRASELTARQLVNAAIAATDAYLKLTQRRRARQTQVPIHLRVVFQMRPQQQKHGQQQRQQQSHQIMCVC